jgi:Armadillo/beta-catenin-like repeat
MSYSGCQMDQFVSLMVCPAPQAGGIAPLVSLLHEGSDEITAELAAVALRNLALQNAANRRAIEDTGGLMPLLALLSRGQEHLVHPLACEVPHLPSHLGQAKCLQGGAFKLMCQNALFLSFTYCLAAKRAIVHSHGMSLSFGRGKMRGNPFPTDGTMLRFMHFSTLLVPLALWCTMLHIVTRGIDKGALPHLPGCVCMEAHRSKASLFASAQVRYLERKGGKLTRWSVPGLCCFDPTSGHLCIGAHKEGGVFACFVQGNTGSPRHKNAGGHRLGRRAMPEGLSQTLIPNAPKPPWA